MNFLACGNISRNKFAMILVPLERGGLRRHFALLYIEIHRRNSEISSLEVSEAGIFCSVYLGFPYVHYPPPHEEISITMFISPRRITPTYFNIFENIMLIYERADTRVALDE